ncbi:MAG: YqgE/AlgH family protein, partial [Caulobacteraceae bacterium]
MPGIEDPRFERAVIFLCAHDADHAMGLTVNRPVEGLTIAKLLAKLGVKSSARTRNDLVLMGGPVEPERGFVLHTDDYACEPSSMAIGGGVALTATREVLEALAGAEDRPRRAIMALGYAGWQPGQLEREI